MGLPWYYKFNPVYWELMGAEALGRRGQAVFNAMRKSGSGGGRRKIGKDSRKRKPEGGHPPHPPKRPDRPPKRPKYPPVKPRVRGRYITHGKIGMSFGGGRRTKRNNRYLRNGVVSKYESRTIATDSDCVYVGHYSLPPDAVMQTAMRALARVVMKEHGQVLSDVNQESEEAAINVFVNVRYAFNGVLFTYSAGTGARPTIFELGEAIESTIMLAYNNVANTGRYFEIVDFVFKTNANAEQVCNFRGNACVFKINAKSIAAIQNRTKSGDTAVDQSTRADDVENNPLQGKHYVGWGNIHTYRFNNDSLGTCPTLSHNAQNGILSQIIQDETNFTDEMKTALRKPPPRSSFGGVSSSSYVKLGPGSIRYNRIRSVLSLNINQLVDLFIDNYVGQAAFDTSSVATNSLINKGSSHFFGFEKVLETDSSVESKISVGMEVNLVVSVDCLIRKTYYMAPLNVIT